MATLTTFPTTVLNPTNQTSSVPSVIAQANEDLVNAVVDNSLKSGTTDGAPDDTLLQIAIWIVDTAGTIAQDALSLTQFAPASDVKAQQTAQCARNWAIVAALVSIIVTIIIIIVTTICSFGAAAGLVSTAVAAVAACIAAVCTIITNVPNVTQMAQCVVWSLSALQAVVMGATLSDQARLKQDAVTQLRNAMAMVQASAALHSQATCVDLNQSEAASDQTSRALQKLLGYLRQKSPTGRLAVLVSELSQLAQRHGAIATQLKGGTR